jgi:hypothetical protein
MGKPGQFYDNSVLWYAIMDLLDADAADFKWRTSGYM